MFRQVWLSLLMIVSVKCDGYDNSGAWSAEFSRFKTPQDTMVDVVNNLALKLLAIHNEGNDNNIALSPYGALSVLVALKEGVRGEAALEIHQASGIPSDLSVIRIGLRDIHRHLKSYFIPDEGFLSGLSLSHDNVTLHREYEDILKFYGFDINSFNNGLDSDFSTTENSVSTTDSYSTTTEIATSTSTAEMLTATTEETDKKLEKEISTTEILSTTTDIVRSTRSEAPTTLESMSTTTELPTVTTIEPVIGTSTGSEAPATNPVMSTATEVPTSTVTTTEPATSTRSEPTAPTTYSESISTTTKVPTTTEHSTSTSIKETTTITEITTVLDSEAPTVQTTDASTEVPSTELSSTITSTTESSAATSESSTMQATEGGTIAETSSPESISSTEDASMSAEIKDSTTEAASSAQSGDLNDTSAREPETIFTSLTNDTSEREPGTVFTTLTMRNAVVLNEEVGKNADEYKNDDESLRRGTRSVVDYIIARYYDDHTITQRPPPYNAESDLYFLINGKYKESNINYMTYDTVLPFYYISHLNTLALRFPLDSSRYYLLLLLPEEPQQINKLICDLRLNTSLKYITENLRYTHVKAVIPSFMLKGYTILTPTLQKMGIGRVFEPRQADFSPMTANRGLYVTNIEQAITVNIRNYVDPTTMNDNRYLHRSNPVLFKADHPFLYFVIDSQIDVTLMAGKIINPLNSRIR